MLRRTLALAASTLIAGLLWLVVVRPVVAMNPDPAFGGRVADTGVENCFEGVQSSGALWRICMPPAGYWNGQLVVYAHGYMAIYRPIEIPEEQQSLPGYPYTVDELINTLGYGFATTSYYTNGLAVKAGLADLTDLVSVFEQEVATPTKVILAGVSEGGINTALAIERHPDTFDGGLALCGPYGGFHEQIDYFGNFRVLFDYFFPGLMPGDPVTIPASLFDTWETGFYSTTIFPVISDPANAFSVTQLLAVADVSPWAFDPPTSTASIETLLWYNVYATEDAKRKLGGQPFDNVGRVYTGSDDDVALNAGVARFAADPAALEEVDTYYQTTGVLTVPLVTLHTTGDPVVPYLHAILYGSKVSAAGSGARYHHIMVDRHGHCSFTSDEVLGAFSQLQALMTYRVYVPAVLRS